MPLFSLNCFSITWNLGLSFKSRVDLKSASHHQSGFTIYIRDSGEINYAKCVWHFLYSVYRVSTRFFSCSHKNKTVVAKFYFFLLLKQFCHTVYALFRPWTKNEINKLSATRELTEVRKRPSNFSLRKFQSFMLLRTFIAL